MKKVIFFMLIVCFTASSGYSSGIGDWLKGPKKSKSTVKLRRCYERELNKFVINAFKQELTGGQMDTNMRIAIENKIYRQMLKDYKKTKKWAKKNLTKRNIKNKFDFQVRSPRGYETEATVYATQFKKFITDFVGDPVKTGRLSWDDKEVSEFLTKEKLQPYIDAVILAYENRTIANFKKLKP